MVELNPKIKSNINRLLLKHGLEIDTFDLEANWDSSLTYIENKNNIESKLPHSQEKIAEETDKDKIQAEQQKILDIETIRAKEELDKSIKLIQNSTNSEIDKYFIILNEYIDTLINSKSINGLIIEGDAGLGKSFNCIKRLKDKKLEFERDWIMLNTHVSPMEMYQFLWKNQEKIIILDDISNLFEDETKVNILMSALWSATNKRIITWASSTTKLDAPTNFEFKGKMLILTNKIPNQFETLQSRCFFYELKFDYETKMKIIYEIGNLQKIPIEVLDFIKNNSTPATTLNFRTLFKLSEIYKTNKNNGWTTLGMLELEADENKKILLDILKTFGNLDVREQITEFSKLTGLSRRSFYNYRNKLCLNVSNKNIKI